MVALPRQRLGWGGKCAYPLFESEDRETVQVSYSTPYRALMATVDITLP